MKIRHIRKAETLGYRDDYRNRAPTKVARAHRTDTTLRPLRRLPDRERLGGHQGTGKSFEPAKTPAGG
jgi:hypothetical protein